VAVGQAAQAPALKIVPIQTANKLQMSDLIGYFGYGSLVNRDTHGEGVIFASPAFLRGWRRHWQSRGLDDVDRAHIALLSVHRYETATIGGMVVVDRRENLEALDRREARYDRIAIPRDEFEILHDHDQEMIPSEIYLYVGRTETIADPAPLLLQSYLDTVLAGFLREHGEAGLEAFIASTLGFERRIVMDREKPYYARAVAIPADLAFRFDEMLSRAGVEFE
jgi:cation transport regulator ChaC